MSRMPQKQSGSDKQPYSLGDMAYYEERLKERIYSVIIEAFEREARAGRITRADLARRIRKAPEIITRLLSGPSNLRLETISNLLLGMDAELDVEVAFFRDRVTPNFEHELVAFLGENSNMPKEKKSTSDTTVVAENNRPETKGAARLELVSG